MSYIDEYGQGRKLVNGKPRRLGVDGYFDENELEFEIPFDDPHVDNCTRVSLTLEDVIKLRDDLTAKIAAQGKI